MRRYIVYVTMIITIISLHLFLHTEATSQNFPTKENPLVIDEKGKRVLIYTEVHEMNVHQYNVH